MDDGKIEAVIWDFGGVITTSPFEAFRRFERERGLPVDFLRKVNATNHLDNAWARFERNDIDLMEFDRAFAEESSALGFAVRGAEVIELLAGTVRPAMVEALRRLKSRVKLGLITNNVATAGGGMKVGGGGRDEILGLFDHVIESSKAGVRKPDPRIYLMMLDALEAGPGQAVFLDDLGVNLKPAREIGMRTIKVEDPDEALARLEALVGFALR